jgi:hypothetical protein
MQKAKAAPKRQRQPKKTERRKHVPAPPADPAIEIMDSSDDIHDEPGRNPHPVPESSEDEIPPDLLPPAPNPVPESSEDDMPPDLLPPAPHPAPESSEDDEPRDLLPRPPGGSDDGPCPPHPVPGADRRKRKSMALGPNLADANVPDEIQILPVVNNEGHTHIVKNVLPLLKHVMLQEEHCRKPPRQQVEAVLNQMQAAGNHFWGKHQLYAHRKTVTSIVKSHYYDSTRALL